METRELIPGTLVTHPEHGVSKILDVVGSKSEVVLEFPSGQKHLMQIREALDLLTTRPSGGLADCLYDKPDAINDWIYGDSLRLVGLTLVDLGGCGKAGDIKERLEPILPAADKWKRWWENVSKSISKHPSHFERTSSQIITLICPVEDIPIERTSPPKTAATRTTKRMASNQAAQIVQELEERHGQERDNFAADLQQLRESHAADLALQRENHANELQKQRESHYRDLKKQRQAFREDRETYIKDLDLMKQGYEDLLQGERSLVEGLRNQIAQRREESRLDIRRGMLETIADTLRNVQGHSQGSHDKLLSEVKVGLEIALLAGGARWYAQPGEIVEFDPRHHEGLDRFAKGSPVKVQSKGALIPGDLTPDFVLMKARVVEVTEVK